MECRRHGRKWRVGLGSRSVLVEHSVGLLHLAVLVANPRQEIRAIDLAASVAAPIGRFRPALSRQMLARA